MRLHESHEEGGFGVPNNTVSRHAASLYTTNVINARFVAFLCTFARPAQQVWLPGNDIQDPSTWDAPPFRTLMRLHDSGTSCSIHCSDQCCSTAPAAVRAGGGAADNAGENTQPQHARLPGQRHRHSLPSAARPPPRGILGTAVINTHTFKRSQVPPPASSSSQGHQPSPPPQ